MDAQARTMIERIDEKIRSLQQLRAGILEQFGDQTSTNHKPESQPKANTRKAQVIAYFKTHGRRTAKELEEETKIPRGSIAWILNDKSLFSRDEDGKYGLI